MRYQRPHCHRLSFVRGPVNRAFHTIGFQPAECFADMVHGFRRVCRCVIVLYLIIDTSDFCNRKANITIFPAACGYNQRFLVICFAHLRGQFQSLNGLVELVQSCTSSPSIANAPDTPLSHAPFSAHPDTRSAPGRPWQFRYCMPTLWCMIRTAGAAHSVLRSGSCHHPPSPIDKYRRPVSCVRLHERPSSVSGNHSSPDFALALSRNADALSD